MFMLGSQRLVAFVATCDAARAKAFYGEKLGLRLTDESGFAVVFDAHGTMLRVQIVQKLTPAPYTALGWEVPDIVKTVRGLDKKGIQFERYKGMPQDELGIWKSPSGSQVAWFKDPDGNTLSLSQF